MTRRLVLAALPVVLLAGCSLKDAFTAHEDVVAKAGEQRLTVERVAAMLAPAKQVPLRREVVDRVAEMWVDYQLLARAVASGDSLLDSATVAAATWALAVQAIANHLHDSLVAAIKPTPAQVDSAYNGNDYRLVSHILVSVRGDSSDAQKAARRRQAEGYLAELRRGAPFAALARRVSEDPGTKQNGGSLGLVGRGTMVRPFEDAAFALRPGQTSDIVETPFGYHIIWRPALAEARDSFATHLEDLMRQRFDSVFLDSLTNRTDIRVRSRAPALVRSAASNLREAKNRSRTLATFRGGTLGEADFARWLQAFPQQTRGMVLQADDSTLKEFVKSIARNVILINQAAARHISLTREDWDSIRARYREDLMAMETGMGIAPDSLSAGTAAGGPARLTEAARRVDAYFTAITNQSAPRQYFEVPPFLGDLLRSRAQWSISAAAVNRALERARQLRGPEQPGGTGTLQPMPVRPRRAPGGPPLGGDTATRR